MRDNFKLKYIIGFPIKDDHVLLIHRNKNPWLHKWNGAGGKLESGESPEQAFYREFREEADIDLQLFPTHFSGIVTWAINEDETNIDGMYAFISRIPANQSFSWDEERRIEEGTIAWKSLQWATDKMNKEIAENLPYFLPLMLTAKEPKRYHCIFRNHVMQEIKVLPLPQKIA